MWSIHLTYCENISIKNLTIRSTGGNGRFKRDVLIHKPTAMTVDFGMNDGNYKAFDEPGFKTKCPPYEYYRFQSCLVASRAPSAMASNLAQAILG